MGPIRVKFITILDEMFDDGQDGCRRGSRVLTDDDDY